MIDNGWESEGSQKKTTYKKTTHTGEKYKESKIPMLIESIKDKVVLIKSISNNGISEGSGFFISSKGEIITNHHVVKNATSIIVKTTNEKEYVAQIVQSDSFVDLALLKANIDNTPFLEMGYYDNVLVGETVIAIGAPLGFEQTVSRGIISAKRNMSIDKGYEKYLILQSDVEMTHGNSGGPLVNLYGEAIGINTFKITEDGPMNFSISCDEALNRFSIR